MKLLLLFVALFNAFAVYLNVVAYFYHGHHWYNLLFTFLNTTCTILMSYDLITWRPVK